MSSGTAMGASGDSGTSSANVPNDESIWHGRDELIRRPVAAHLPATVPVCGTVRAFGNPAKPHGRAGSVRRV